MLVGVGELAQDQLGGCRFGGHDPANDIRLSCASASTIWRSRRDRATGQGVASYAGMGLRGTILKLHVYAGLLTFGQLMIYGVAGLSAAFQPGLERPKIPHTVRYLPFTPAPSATTRKSPRPSIRLSRHRSRGRFQTGSCGTPPTTTCCSTSTM